MASSCDHFASRASDGSPTCDGNHSRLAAEYRDCVTRYLICLAELRTAERRLRAASGGLPKNGEQIEMQREAETSLAECNGRANGMTLYAIEDLSAREFEVFALIGEGLATHEVAKQLNLATSTVETYRERLKTKLKLNSGAALTRHAILWAASLHSPIARI
jgi:DNA-binding NarL/FixJ family response regulator